MKIAHLDIEPDVLLAPMAAVTDLPFRTICEEHGVGLTITEFLSANALCAGAKKELAKLTASIGGRRFGVQILVASRRRWPWRRTWRATSARRWSTSTWVAQPSAWWPVCADRR